MEFTITREMPAEDVQITLDVSYRRVGSYIPATYYNPAEYPEIDLISAIGDDGVDYVDQLTDDEVTEIVSRIENDV